MDESSYSRFESVLPALVYALGDREPRVIDWWDERQLKGRKRGSVGSNIPYPDFRPSSTGWTPFPRIDPSSGTRLGPPKVASGPIKTDLRYLVKDCYIDGFISTIDPQHYNHLEVTFGKSYLVLIRAKSQIEPAGKETNVGYIHMMEDSDVDSAIKILKAVNLSEVKKVYISGDSMLKSKFESLFGGDTIWV